MVGGQGLLGRAGDGVSEERQLAGQGVYGRELLLELAREELPGEVVVGWVRDRDRRGAGGALQGLDQALLALQLALVLEQALFQLADRLVVLVDLQREVFQSAVQHTLAPRPNLFQGVKALCGGHRRDGDGGALRSVICTHIKNYVCESKD